MINMKKLHCEYITDENGNKKSVILSIEDFYELIEDIEDLAAIAERRNEPAVSHEKVLEELRKNGIIQYRVETFCEKGTEKDTESGNLELCILLNPIN